MFGNQYYFIQIRDAAGYRYMAAGVTRGRLYATMVYLLKNIDFIGYERNGLNSFFFLQILCAAYSFCKAFWYIFSEAVIFLKQIFMKFLSSISTFLGSIQININLEM